MKIDESSRGKTPQVLLAGAEFKLYRNTGTTSVAYTPYPDEDSSVKTTSDVAGDDYGTVRFDDLPSGQYKIVETATPTGYVKTDNNAIYFDIVDGVLTRYSGPYTGADRAASEEIAEQENVAKVTYVRENVA